MNTTARMTRRGALGAFGALAVLGLAACGSADEQEVAKPAASDPATGDTQASDAGGTTGEATAEETTEAAPQGGTPNAEAPIGTEITDGELGDTITIVSVRRDVPSTLQERAVADGGEVFYLQLSATPGQEYGGVLTERDFYVNPGEPDEDNTMLTLDDEIIAAGLPLFEGATRRDGGTVTGWIGFVAEKRKDTYPGAYIRPEVKILGQDTRIPEFRADFVVPAA